MPNSRSATKRMRQNRARRLRNRTVRSAMRTQIKKVLQAVAQSDLASAETQLRAAVKKLDQAASKRIVHRNTAARVKSRLAHRVNRLKAAGAAPA
jgi:small subunit ribosomal protein S20